MAGVQLPRVFGDHMIVQARVRLPIWSMAEPGEIVSVDFDGDVRSVSADEDGHWQMWCRGPNVNIFNQTGFPASPFSTESPAEQ